MAVAISNTASFEYTAVDADHDEAGVAIGTAVADRLVFVCASGLTGLEASSLDTMTIGGVSATRARRDLVTYDGSGAGFFQSLEIWWALVPTGVTATISFTHGADYFTAKFSVYNVAGAATASPISDNDGASRADALSNALSVSVDVPENGGAIGLIGGPLYTTSVAAAWTYLTEDLDNDDDAGGVFIGFSTASAVTIAAATGQAITATLTGGGTAASNARGLSVVTISAFVDPDFAAASATGSATAQAVTAALASSGASAAAVGAGTGATSLIASVAANTTGAATAEAIGDFLSESVPGSASGAATATAITALIASVAGLSEGSASATAEPPAIPAATYPPVGGGGGIAPPYYSEKQRFRIRKEKSKPRVYVIKTGNWPTEEELARAEREEQQEFSRFVNGIQPSRPAPVGNDDEEELVAILSMLA